MDDKMWAGRFTKELDKNVNDFNSSISFDKRLYAEDITGSIAHADMLGKQGIIPSKDAEQIILILGDIKNDIESGELKFDGTAEDIHMFIEAELTARVGYIGKRLHTARSRNDQVALDMRLYLMNQINSIGEILAELLLVLCDIAEKHTGTVMPGYTHLQRAQPVTMAHHLCAYAQMFLRDMDRLSDTSRRTNISPIGSCALAGTSYPIDRELEASNLGFDGITENSIDGVSDRDFVIELGSALSILMMHLSRFSEEIILWCSWEFRFADLDDAYATGSSIMPQKKNPDIPELIRGKTGRVYGDLIALLTMMKGLPLAYNKDMQEDKEAIFDAIDTVILCLRTFKPMIETMKINTENCRAAAAAGFINATDCADYLTKKGIPFRMAYKITGQIVEYCIKNNKTLDTLTLDEYQKFDPEFEEDIFEAINLDNCIKARDVYGGPTPERVQAQIGNIRINIAKLCIALKIQ
ncbi:MAG: argininosuccinate lyase [Ruminococcus sp.]|jgi:argininosuccinate lyase|nr:argininosuccinate lyase [Ruminococcus sp.]